MRKLMRHASVFLVSVVYLACFSNALAASDDLVAAAKKEGTLRIIVFPSLKNAANAFEKQYGIKVEGTYVGAPPILRKVSQESEAGIFAVDAFTTSPQLGGKLNKWTMPYKPAGYDAVADAKASLPDEWNQIPILTHVIGVSYNKDVVTPEKVPRSIYDLLKPEYKGKIISRTPWLGSNFSVHVVSYYSWFGGDEEKWTGYWSKLKNNVGRYEPKFPTLHAAVGLKEYPLGIFTLPYTPFTFGRSYPGLAYATFRESAIWWPNLLAIHKNAPHPNAAKLFVDFMVSAEGQKLLIAEGLLPANKNMKPVESLRKELEGVKLFADAPETMATEVSEHGDKWREKIQKIYK